MLFLSSASHRPGNLKCRLHSWVRLGCFRLCSPELPASALCASVCLVTFHLISLPSGSVRPLSTRFVTFLLFPPRLGALRLSLRLLWEFGAPCEMQFRVPTALLSEKWPLLVWFPGPNVLTESMSCGSVEEISSETS